MLNYSAAVTAAAAPVAWGSTYLVTTELLPPDRPLAAAVLRALPAGLLLVAMSRQLPTGSWWWRAALLGLLNIGAFFALLFVAAYRLPGGLAATLGAIQPLLVAALAVRLIGERPTRASVVAGVVGAAGVAVLVLRADARLDLWGVLAALGGALVMSIGVVLTRRWGSPVPLLAMTGWQLVAGSLFLLPVMIVVEGAPPWPLTASQVAGYAYLTLIGTAVAYTLWFHGLRQLPALQASALGLLSPVVATTLGWVILDQALTLPQLAGGVAVLGAVLLAQRRPAARSVPATDDADATAARQQVRTLTPPNLTGVPARNPWNTNR